MPTRDEQRRADAKAPMAFVETLESAETWKALVLFRGSRSSCLLSNGKSDPGLAVTYIFFKKNGSLDFHVNVPDVKILTQTFTQSRVWNPKHTSAG